MPTIESRQIPGISLTSILPTQESELLTGVPIFFGLATSENNEPKLLKLISQFEQYFTAVKGYLAEVVKGFFDNGGSCCYVMPLADNTLETLKAALEASEVLENIDLVCVPDIMLLSEENEILDKQKAVLEYCERMGDRFAILDGLNTNVDDLDWQRQELSSNNGALYAPWIKVEERRIFIPPCGHIAGTYASRDQVVGVHSAPANIELEGVLDLSFSLTPAAQLRLNPITGGGVNCILSFPGKGIRAWGVRTISQLEEWKYISVRRLFLTVGRWVNWNLADTVFENNDFQLWARLQREITFYCDSLWQAGALQGEQPEQAFYVKCDAETNPSENREMGTVVAEVGLAPAIPGEFIQLLLVQTSTGITVA